MLIEQHHSMRDSPDFKPSTHFGVVFLELLELYGFHFPYAKLGIHLRSRAFLSRIDTSDEKTLCIIDPQLPGM